MEIKDGERRTVVARLQSGVCQEQLGRVWRELGRALNVGMKAGPGAACARREAAFLEGWGGRGRACRVWTGWCSEGFGSRGALAAESPQRCPVGTAAAAPDCVLRAGGLRPGAEPSYAFSTHGVFEERAAAAAPLARGRFGQISFASQNEKGRIEGGKNPADK